MQNPLIGLWSLVSWDTIYADGRVHPYSAAPVGGFIHYGSDGLMAVSIYAKHQQSLLTTYAGRYEQMGQEVLHMPLEGNSPDGIQEVKRRYCVVTEGVLYLSTAWTPAADSLKYQLKWQRIN